MKTLDQSLQKLAAMGQGSGRGPGPAADIHTAFKALVRAVGGLHRALSDDEDAVDFGPKQSDVQQTLRKLDQARNLTHEAWVETRRLRL